MPKVSNNTESLKKALSIFENFLHHIAACRLPDDRQPIMKSCKNPAQFSEPRTSLFEGLCRLTELTYPIGKVFSTSRSRRGLDERDDGSVGTSDLLRDSFGVKI